MRFARIEPGIVFAASLLAAVSGCVAPRAAAPPPVPPPRPAPAPAPAPVEDWRDIALTPGDWSYRNDAAGSEALFGDRALIVRCDTVRRQVRIERPDAAAASLVVRTSFGSRHLAAGETLAPRDPLLDQIAFSRGRFTIEASVLPMLVVPAWPEPARVIEDCRN